MSSYLPRAMITCFQNEAFPHPLSCIRGSQGSRPRSSGDEGTTTLWPCRGKNSLRHAALTISHSPSLSSLSACSVECSNLTFKQPRGLESANHQHAALVLQLDANLVLGGKAWPAHRSHWGLWLFEHCATLEARLLHMCFEACSGLCGLRGVAHLPQVLDGRAQAPPNPEPQKQRRRIRGIRQINVSQVEERLESMTKNTDSRLALSTPAYCTVMRHFV